MKHLAITESELPTLLYALRCGESQLLELMNDTIEKGSPRTLKIVRDCHEMRMTLIRLENQLEPEE